MYVLVIEAKTVIKIMEIINPNELVISKGVSCTFPKMEKPILLGHVAELRKLLLVELESLETFLLHGYKVPYGLTNGSI